ncbi:MAG: hypothetical protein CM1200mP28_08280 [Deltaproteobacteria bacterium]|nr:MAG: hypothetical protein CM1200mP28_08280 [Deltaproteobacteria bacterium]
MCSCGLLGGIAQGSIKPAERVDAAGTLSENHHKNFLVENLLFRLFLNA